jgi:hypothetical protein
MSSRLRALVVSSARLRSSVKPSRTPSTPTRLLIQGIPFTSTVPCWPLPFHAWWHSSVWSQMFPLATTSTLRALDLVRQSQKRRIRGRLHELASAFGTDFNFRYFPATKSMANMHVVSGYSHITRRGYSQSFAVHVRLQSMLDVTCQFLRNHPPPVHFRNRTQIRQEKDCNVLSLMHPIRQGRNKVPCPLMGNVKITGPTYT